MQSTLPPARRKRRRRALNIPAVVGLVLLVLALVLGALLMLVRGQGRTPGAEAFVPAAGPLPEVQADRAQSREGEEFHYFCDHGTLPPPKREPALIDNTIERPARKISMFTNDDDEAAVLPAAETPTEEPANEESSGEETPAEDEKTE